MKIRLTIFMFAVCGVVSLPANDVSESNLVKSMIGEMFLDVIDIYILKYNGLFAGDAPFVDGDFDVRLVPENLKPHIERALIYFKNSFDDISRVSIIIEFNRANLFLLDNEYKVIAHVPVHNDGILINIRSGPKGVFAP